MHSIVQDKLETLKELCFNHRVERLDIFGSAARGDFNPESSEADIGCWDVDKSLLYDEAEKLPEKRS